MTRLMSDPPNKSILFVSGDLMFASRLRGIEENISCSVTLCGAAASLEQALAQKRPDVVIVDLEMPGLDIADVMSRLPGDHRPVVIAYAPHVHEARLAAARTASCDHVLSRGQFNARIDQLLRALVNN